MSLDDKVENIINEKLSLLRRGINFLKRKALPYLLVGSMTVTGIIGCTTRSTPEATVKSYISAIKEGDLEEIFKYQGLTDEDIETIRGGATQQELDDIANLAEKIRNDPFSIDIVKTKYAILENEEVAIIQTIFTAPDGRKEQRYVYLANHNGEWTVFKEFGERLPWGTELYDNPTTNKKSPSKLVEEHIKDLTSALLRERIRENENFIHQFLRELSTKAETYRVRYGKYGSLNDLIEKGLINKDKNFENISGYIIKQAKIFNTAEYAFKAIPLKNSVTGNYSFYVDQSGIIYKSTSTDLNQKGEPISAPRGLTINKAKELDGIRELIKNGSR